MIVFLNGRFVSEEQALVSVFDRGFLYGDGLFEALRVAGGKPFRWGQHMERFRRGAQFLKISLPLPPEAIREAATELLSRNEASDALLRITLSRGIGLRGYSPKGAEKPTFVVSSHPLPPFDPKNPARWRLITASFRLPANEPLAEFKTCNKLPQVLARAEADDAGADEALLLNTDGFIVEGASSNLFWIDDHAVCTSPLASGVLAGVTRATVFEICRGLGCPVREASVTPDALRRSQAVFLSLSSLGIAEILSIDGQSMAQSPLLPKLRTAYWDLVRAETR
jgi:branched-chain amino acid aminotransferase